MDHVVCCAVLCSPAQGKHATNGVQDCELCDLQRPQKGKGLHSSRARDDRQQQLQYAANMGHVRTGHTGPQECSKCYTVSSSRNPLRKLDARSAGHCRCAGLSACPHAWLLLVQLQLECTCCCAAHAQLVCRGRVAEGWCCLYTGLAAPDSYAGSCPMHSSCSLHHQYCSPES